MEFFLAAAALLYVAELLFLRLGLSRADAAVSNHGSTPAVSVIVAARNEERLIGACITSLLELDYPAGQLEIVVVNDGSTDRTLEIATSFLSSHPQLKVISATPGRGNLRGKTNAVAQGIKASRGEILLFTDADCQVPRGWVTETAGLFDERTGVVGGFTLLETRGIFDGMQGLDWVFLFALASATIGWGFPLTAIGNNLAIRRKAYDDVGGYEEIPFSVTEDYSLVQTIIRKTPFNARFPLRAAAVVITQPCTGWKHLYNQKKRWGVGGLDMILRGKLVMAVGWLAKLALLLTLPFIPITVWAGWLFAIIAGEMLFLLFPLKRFGAVSRLWYYPFFAIYFTLYVLVLPFIALFSRRVVWKERQHLKDE
jgi:1,2-diacylglycerol 3-beta-glucosyltransferase